MAMPGLTETEEEKQSPKKEDTVIETIHTLEESKK